MNISNEQDSSDEENYTNVIQGQVNELVTVLEGNVNKLRDRDGRLSQLERKGESLMRKANEFKKLSRKVRCRQWCKAKGCIILVIILFILVLVTTVTVVIIYYNGHITF